ncbi:MAG: glycoside hydrolase, partial [Acidobacteriaceae bacterium]|nr:glycoside hydrolase [Acidobacteriaceae bacterium]
MRKTPISLLVFLTISLPFAHAQGTVPTFQRTIGAGSYTLVGRDPVQGGVTTIPTVLVPITLSLDAKTLAGKPFLMDAAPDVQSILRSPVLSNFAFPSG